ncbi:MAG TPA: hypothetical protein PLQ78_06145 [Flavipsychrobacter sp.]|jgi:hypothetical protein|nr:hypothetical protein [Flavipsychrobacter sp.]
MLKASLIKAIKFLFRPSYYWYKRVELRVHNIIYQSKIEDAKQIPIIINNRNRLSTLKSLVDALVERGYQNIHILDNDSTYPPLLDYYKTLPFQVHYLVRNVGYMALWKTPIHKQFIKDFYVYTDSDVVPIEACPDDFMEVFRKLLQQYTDVQKVGFSLKIDDLPDAYANKQQVIEWEKKYFEKKMDDYCYEAPIDTTFALYRPGAKGKASLLRMLRTAYPYEARHLPWYVDSNHLSEEEKYYINHVNTSTHWTQKPV